MKLVGLCQFEEPETLARPAAERVDQTQPPIDRVERISVEVVAAQSPCALIGSDSRLEIAGTSFKLAETDIDMEAQRAEWVTQDVAFLNALLRQAPASIEFSELREVDHHSAADRGAHSQRMLPVWDINTRLGTTRIVSQQRCEVLR